MTEPGVSVETLLTDPDPHHLKDYSMAWPSAGCLNALPLPSNVKYGPHYLTQVRNEIAKVFDSPPHLSLFTSRSWNAARRHTLVRYVMTAVHCSSMVMRYRH